MILCDSNYGGYTTRHLFQRITDHRYSAIGRHLRDAHGNIDLLSESQFRMLKKCSTKWDCLVYEMLYIKAIRPNLNTQSDSIELYHAILKQKNLPVQPHIQCEAGRAKTKLFVLLGLKWPPCDKGLLGPNSLFNFHCRLIYSSLHYMYSISLFYFHLIMTFWKRRNVVLCFMFYNILSQKNGDN